MTPADLDRLEVAKMRKMLRTAADYILKEDPIGEKARHLATDCTWVADGFWRDEMEKLNDEG